MAVALPLLFRRFECASAAELADARFQFFVDHVLSGLTEGGTMIYVKSYLDFVRLRNHLRRTDTSFTQICEYTSDAKVRDLQGNTSVFDSATSAAVRGGILNR